MTSKGHRRLKYCKNKISIIAATIDLQHCKPCDIIIIIISVTVVYGGQCLAWFLSLLFFLNIRFRIFASINSESLSWCCISSIWNNLSLTMTLKRFAQPAIHSFSSLLVGAKVDCLIHNLAHPFQYQKECLFFIIVICTGFITWH